MALFVKKIAEESMHYSISAQKTIIIAGLGNPGTKYTNTRHNVGFMCLDRFQKMQSEFADWSTKKGLRCQLSSGSFGQTKVILLKPDTFMNDSGHAMRVVLDFYKLPLTSVSVVHDELDLAFGQIRTRFGGSHAGHNGIRSIIQHAGDQFGRIRIGVDNEHNTDDTDSANFVLSNFNGDEQKQLHMLGREVSSILTELVYRGELYPETRNILL